MPAAAKRELSERDSWVGAGKLFVVENYVEAVGVMTALKEGVAASAVGGALVERRVTREEVKDVPAVRRTQGETLG